MAATTHGYRAGSGLRISEPLHGGEREFRIGADVAYGWAEPDGSCGLTHAPDQGQLDRVAAALDAMEMDDVAALLSQPDTHATTTMQCEHQAYTTGDARPFNGPVGPFDRQNPAAHGCVRYVDTCSACGSRRERNVNGCRDEVGAWGPSAAERERRQSEEEARERREVRAREEAREDALLAAAGVTIVERSGDYLCVYRGAQKSVATIADVRAAAAQDDQVLRAYYRGLLRRAGVPLAAR